MNRALHEARIGREFKLVLSTITFFMVCAGAKLSGKLPVFTKTVLLFDVIVVEAFVFVLIMSYLYLKGSAKANDRNQKAAEVAENVEDKYLEGAPPQDWRELYRKESKCKELPADKHPNRARWIGQWIAIFVGAGLSCVLILCA